MSYANFEAREQQSWRELSHAMDEDDRRVHVKLQGTGQIVAQTRNPVTVPQCLVNLAADVPKGETKRRHDDAQHDASELLAPPASNDGVHKLQKGMLVMMRATDEGGFNTNMNSDSGVEAVGALNGLHKSVQFVLPGVVQTLSDPSDLADNQAQSTIAVHGVQTIGNMGASRIHTGDRVMVGKCPPLVKLDASTGKFGPRIGPMIKGPDGYSPETVCWPVVPVRATTHYAFITNAQHVMRQRMADPAFFARVSKIVAPSALYALFVSETDTMFSTDMIVDEDNPIRGFILMWAALRWWNILCLEPDRLGASANLGQHKRMALAARLRACQESEDRFSKEGEDYGATLPHDGDREDLALSSLKRSRSTLTGDHILQLVGTVKPGATLPAMSNLGMLEAVTRVSMHEASLQLQFYSRIHAHFAQYMLGTALSSADKGMAMDIFVGKM